MEGHSPFHTLFATYYNITYQTRMRDKRNIYTIKSKSKENNFILMSRNKKCTCLSASNSCSLFSKRNFSFSLSCKLKSLYTVKCKSEIYFAKSLRNVWLTEHLGEQYASIDLTQKYPIQPNEINFFYCYVNTLKKVILVRKHTLTTL